MTAVLASGICSASTRQITASAPLVSPPPINSVGVLIDLRFALQKRLAVLADLTKQRMDIVAQLLPRRRRPAASTRLHRRSRRRKAQARRRCRRFAPSRPRPERAAPAATRAGRRTGRLQRGSRSPPGSARIALRSRSGRACATRKPICPPREWPSRSTGPAFSSSMKPMTSADVLRHQIVAADPVPMLRKEPPQAQRNHAMLFRQRAQHGIPGAEIAERAMHEHQRRAIAGTSADIEIGHVVSVDAERLHAVNPLRDTREQSRNISAAPVRTSDAWRSGSSRCATPSRWPPAHAAPAAACPWCWRRR